MTTAEAMLDIGSIDAATGALSRVAELERSVRKSPVLKGVSRVLKRVQLTLLLTLVNVLDVRSLLIMGVAHWKSRRLTSYMNRAAFDGDEGLAELQGIAKRCGDLVQCLDRLYRQRRRLGPLLPLNGLVLPQLENLICEVEDIGETAALSGSAEIRASILEQLAAHGISERENPAKASHRLFPVVDCEKPHGVLAKGRCLDFSKSQGTSQWQNADTVTKASNNHL